MENHEFITLAIKTWRANIKSCLICTIANVLSHSEVTDTMYVPFLQQTNVSLQGRQRAPSASEPHTPSHPPSHQPEGNK